MTRFLSFFGAIILITFVSNSCFAGKVIQKTQQGNPQLKSINVISFAPEGVLLIGDGRGSQIIAVETPKFQILRPGESIAADGGRWTKN